MVHSSTGKFVERIALDFTPDDRRVIAKPLCGQVTLSRSVLYRRLPHDNLEHGVRGCDVPAVCRDCPSYLLHADSATRQRAPVRTCGNIRMVRLRDIAIVLLYVDRSCSALIAIVFISVVIHNAPLSPVGTPRSSVPSGNNAFGWISQPRKFRPIGDTRKFGTE